MCFSLDCVSMNAVSPFVISPVCVVKRSHGWRPVDGLWPVTMNRFRCSVSLRVTVDGLWPVGGVYISEFNHFTRDRSCGLWPVTLIFIFIITGRRNPSRGWWPADGMWPVTMHRFRCSVSLMVTSRWIVTSHLEAHSFPRNSHVWLAIQIQPSAEMYIA